MNAVILTIAAAPLGVTLVALAWSVARRTRSYEALLRDPQYVARLRARRMEDRLLRREILLGSRTAARLGQRDACARRPSAERE